MITKYYKIEPDLSDAEVATIDSWKFTYWPNKPKGGVVKNPDGTFSVVMEENFIPLVTQLQNLFKDGQTPASGTYIGEAVLTGNNAPADIIYGNFINAYEGLVVSKRLLNLLKKYALPEHYIYDLPLISKRKTYTDYSYILFKAQENTIDLDVLLLKKDYLSVVCVSERVMKEICSDGINGCTFKHIHTGT